MELKIRVANPAGNVTIFVMSPAKREDYPAISRELCAWKNFTENRWVLWRKCRMEVFTCR